VFQETRDFKDSSMGTENIKWLKLLHKATRWFRSVINDPEAATMKKKYVDYSTDNTVDHL